MMQREAGWLCLAIGVVAAFGCGDSSGAGGGGGSEGGGGASAEAVVIDRFGSFEQAGFTRVSMTGTTSQHGNAELVHIWVSDEAVAAYKAIDPDDAEATAGPFPEGTMIVKQNLDAAGEPTGAATVLAKQASGFNPDAGDWYWGRFGEDGALAQGGVVAFCIDCHASNGLESTDWLNGVPTGNQL
jgi:hypothetical protein